MPMWDQMQRNVTSALRQLAHAPMLTLAATITLALGIGANTAIFSLFDAIAFRPLPVSQPEQLVLLGSHSYPAFQQLQTGTTSAVLFAHAGLGVADITIDGQPERHIRDGALVSGNYFASLGVTPVEGRPILAGDDSPAADAAVVVISERLRANRFGAASASSNVIGRTLTINSTTLTIIGVAPASFFGTSVGDVVDLWIPLQALPRIRQAPTGRPDLLHDANATWLTVMGRLAPTASAPDVQREAQLALDANAPASRLPSDAAGAAGRSSVVPIAQLPRLVVQDGSRGVSGLRTTFGVAFTVLMVLVSLLLLIACANVANLFVGRAVSRRREMAIRQALGASGAQLAGQLFTESLLIALMGAALGVLVAIWARDALLAMLMPGQAYAPLELSLDSRMLAITGVTAMIVAVLCGLVPAWQATRTDLRPLMIGGTAAWRESGRGRGRGRGLAMKALLVAQVALSALLLVAAGEVVRSLRHLLMQPTGFDATNQVVLRVDASRTMNPRAMFDQLRDRFATLPGVSAVAMSNSGLFSGAQTNIAVQPQTPAVLMGIAPGYLQSLGLTLLAGRDFTPHDDSVTARVAIVNETLARRVFGDHDQQQLPIDATITIGRNTRYRVIGVVRDTRYRDLRRQSPAILYEPLWQSREPLTAAMFTLRTSTPLTAAMSDQLTREAHQVAPQLLVIDLNSMTALIDRTLATDRLIASLSTAFGLLAILMAAAGLYAVMSTAVARRTQEIGIRAAIGADPARLLRSVLREALVVITIGIAIGLIAAAASANLIAHLLYGLSPRDPLTFAGTTVVLLAIGSLAAYLPARRAARIDPLIAIRQQ